MTVPLRADGLLLRRDEVYYYVMALVGAAGHRFSRAQQPDEWRTLAQVHAESPSIEAR